MKKQPNKPKQPKKTVQDYEQQIGELTESLQRLQAEFINYKKRQNEEQSGNMARAKEMMLSEILPVLDNLDIAANHLPDDLQGNSWAQGVQYIGQQLSTKLDEMGVSKISPLGEKFNHNQHDAIEYVQSDKPEGIITDVITPGYQIGDRLVRPARVKVSGGNNPETK